MTAADAFFPTLRLRPIASGLRSRTLQGIVGTPETLATMRLTVRPEGGHWTFVEVATDQMGESRLDRNVKRFFVTLRQAADPGHALEAAY